MDQEIMYPYFLLDGQSISIQIDGEYRTMQATNGNFNALVAAVESGDKQRVREIMDIRSEVNRQAKGRVVIERDGVYIDGVRRGGRLIDRIMAMVNRGAKTVSHFVAFLENLEKNPAQDARDSLYDFIEHCSLPITSDGCFLAYKFIRDDYMDCHSGTMDNSIGSVVRMNREDVCADRNISCASGLHVCSKEYIGKGTGWGNRLVVCKVNPADVVSVPYSYNMEKMRVCEYKVVDEIFNWDGSPEKEIEHYVTEDHGSDVEDTIEPEVDEPSEAVSNSPDYSQKLTAHNVRQIKRLLADPNMTLTAIASRFGVSRRTIARIRDGELWAHIT